VKSRIQAYLRAVAPLGRDHVQIGPFLATFNPNNDNPYLNYAIPDDAAEPEASDIEALISAYEARRRKPRLEYVPEVAPAVEEALAAAGFTVEGRLPLMVVDAETMKPSQEPPGVALSAPESDEDLYRMIAVQNEAYEEAGSPTAAEVKERREALLTGSLAVIATDVDSGMVVGAGSCSRIRDGLTEVAAIGVAESHRRRGIGQALAGRLASEALAHGAVSPWLMAAHVAEERIYERVGFSTVGSVLHMSL
jgi:GNAT superfamily N-acetyltransferase